MNLEINRAHFPVTVLGPGRRIGIWFQGCKIGCPDCVSRDTWPSDPSRRIDVESLVSWCRDIASGGLDGITISGGEPFDQADGLLRLIEELSNWRLMAGLDFDILCYSGYPWRRLQRKHSLVLERLDAIIPEPFKREESPGLSLRGSANQSLIPLSDRGRRVFANWVDASSSAGMQVAVNGGKVWLIGIPSQGTMDRFAQGCADKGLRLTEMSWQP